MIGKTISHYKIIEKIGSGGMGVVYKAQDLKLDRFVALKFLPPHLTTSDDEKQRFIHEAKAASALDHNNICAIHEIDETEDGQLFISMAYYEGETLEEKIKEKRLKTKDAIEIVIQIAQGLDKAHEKEIVHRDIKPANIILTADGVVKILDFGLAKLSTQTKLTKDGTTLGTIAYMSPEQAKGEDVGYRTDIWSLGVILYEMLTGELPFKGEYESAVIYSIVNDAQEPVTALRSGVPMELERIIDKILSKNPDERYLHCDELAADLKKLVKQIETSREPGNLKAATEKRVGKNIKKYVFPLIAIILAISTFIIVKKTFLINEKSHINSIAVLPLVNLSGDEKQEYFADGMTEALINELSKISALRVISRTSIMQYKNVRKPLPEIARTLNVDAIVEGSVLRVKDKVRITAQLIKAEPEKHLWADDYVRDLQDVLILQKEVAKAIVHKIKIKLTPAEETNLMRTKSVNPEAHELYLLGRFFANTATLESIQKGIKYFQKALEIDTSCALAYLGLADAYATLGNYAILPPNETFPKAKAYAIKALEIDETLAEVHAGLGYIRMVYDWDWEGSENAYKRAIELNPGYSYTYLLYSWYLAAQGRFDKSIETMNRALELNPLSVLDNTMLGQRLYLAGRYDEAIAQLLKTLEMDPDYVEALWNLGLVYQQKKMYQEAIEEFQKAINLSGDMTSIIASLGHTYALSGNKSEAKKILNQLIELSQHKYVSSYDVAVIYTGLGMKDKAVAWLERALKDHDGWIAGWIKVDPRLSVLHSDIRFVELLKTIGLEK